MALTPLDEDARQAFTAQHPEWALEGETITRTFILENFNDAMGFVTRVALAAEVADHHPDIDIRWKKVTLALTTHEANGLTEKDTALAATADSFV